MEFEVTLDMSHAAIISKILYLSCFSTSFLRVSFYHSIFHFLYFMFVYTAVLCVYLPSVFLLMI